MCVCVCVCSLRHSAWNAHAPYCLLWPFRLYSSFPNYLITWADFRKTVVEHKMCWDFFHSNFVWNIFNSQSKWARYYHKCTQAGLTCKVPVIRVRFSRQIFPKNTEIANLMKTCPLGAELFHADGQTDGRRWRSWYSFFSLLRTRPNKYALWGKCVLHFSMFHLPCINQIQKYTNNKQIHFNIYYVFYSQFLTNMFWLFFFMFCWLCSSVQS